MSEPFLWSSFESSKTSCCMINVIVELALVKDPTLPLRKVPWDEDLVYQKEQKRREKRALSVSVQEYEMSQGIFRLASASRGEVKDAKNSGCAEGGSWRRIWSIEKVIFTQRWRAQTSKEFLSPALKILRILGNIEVKCFDIQAAWYLKKDREKVYCGEIASGNGDRKRERRDATYSLPKMVAPANADVHVQSRFDHVKPESPKGIHGDAFQMKPYPENGTVHSDHTKGFLKMHRSAGLNPRQPAFGIAKLRTGAKKNVFLITFRIGCNQNDLENFRLLPDATFCSFPLAHSENILKSTNSLRSTEQRLWTSKTHKDTRSWLYRRIRPFAMVDASKPVAPIPLASKVKICKPEELDMSGMVSSSIIRLGKTPHKAQRRLFSNVMQGRNVVLDSGTGSGKSLCFMRLTWEDKTTCDPRGRCDNVRRTYARDSPLQ
ncbi:hypothetical protein B0H11DRAFT_1921526 [Mycena galericulata]|nr:hypothetical protein B0H11DRAFT_1921526 [Mycena galericulata]